LDDYEISEYMFKLTLPTCFSSKIFLNSELSKLESILTFLSTKNVLDITFFFDIQSCLINLEWLFCEIPKLKLFKTIQMLAHLHTNIRYLARSSAAPFLEEQEMKSSVNVNLSFVHEFKQHNEPWTKEINSELNQLFIL